MRKRFVLVASAALLMAATIPSHAASDYPTKPISLVVGYPAGGGTDIIARIVAKQLGQELGQTVIVENRAGATGTIGANHVAKAAPDGYTLLLSAGSDVTITKLTVPSLPYNIYHDFAPISRVAQTPFLMVTNQKVPASTVNEFVDYAKQHESKLNISASATFSYLNGARFKSLTGLKLPIVQYKGAAQALTDLIGDHVQLGFETVAVSLPQLESKQIKALAVASEMRSPYLPEVPTFAESGMPNVVSYVPYGVLAPKGTPADVIASLQAAISRAVKNPAVQEQMKAQAMEPVVDDTAERYTRDLAESTELWTKLAEEIGYQPGKS
ncbi:tripartite tricarboxylate transporter substrate binding protein [Alcaligenaceae bacterium]|nr:tripartite tricarboxylate transporter substrate binding protein [Alcaligenaceae bacterium]